MSATYTVKQVAKILGYSTNSIYTFLKEKRIKGVRVGKGRFRIPQSELNRLLLTSGKQSTTTPTAIQSYTQPATQLTDISDDSLRADRFKLFGQIQFSFANIFDWFVGIAAVTSGIALFLFNQVFVQNEIIVSNRLFVFSSIRIILIGCGIGILLSNTSGKYSYVWRRIFFLTLSILGILMAVYLWRSGDISGAFTYGSLALSIVVSMLFTIGGLATFSFYLSVLAMAAAVTPIFGPADKNVKAILTMLNLTIPTFVPIMSLSALAFICAIWWGYIRERKIFWLCTWLASFVFFGLSFWFAQQQYWSRSFLYVVIGITSMFAYLWEEMVESKSKREHMLLTGVFIALCSVLVIGVFIVHVMQASVIETVKREDVQKVSYARARTELAVSDVKNTAEGIALTPNLINAFSKKDSGELNIIGRIIFDSNKNIRRIVSLDRNGIGFHLYPYGTFDQPDLSFRDYFRNARDTGQVAVSDVFQSLTDQSRRQVVAVAVPVYEPGHEFIGVLTASMDLDAIGARLQQIGVPDRGEYVTVIDKHGNIIISPDQKLIGTPSDKNDPTRLGLKGSQGVTATSLSDGTSAIVAYDTISGLGWGIGVWTPLAHAYKLTNTATLSVFLLILFCVVTAAVILQGAHVVWRNHEGGP